MRYNIFYKNDTNNLFIFYCLNFIVYIMYACVCVVCVCVYLCVLVFVVCARPLLVNKLSIVGIVESVNDTIFDCAPDVKLLIIIIIMTIIFSILINPYSLLLLLL